MISRRELHRVRMPSLQNSWLSRKPFMSPSSLPKSPRICTTTPLVQWAGCFNARAGNHERCATFRCLRGGYQILFLEVGLLSQLSLRSCVGLGNSTRPRPVDAPKSCTQMQTATRTMTLAEAYHVYTTVTLMLVWRKSPGDL